MTRATDIESQAASWLAKRDAAGQGERATFEAWLAADPRHRAAYLRLAAAWDRTAILKNLRAEGTQIDADLLKPVSARQGSQRLPLALAAGITAIALAAAAVWWIDYYASQTYRTEIGGLARVVLKDGSTLMLNTDTELRVNFTQARRRVELVRGEAQFTVAHDTARPFEVRADSHVVMAVGTAFDVRLDQGEAIQVMVTDGRVVLLDAAPSSGAGTARIETATISAGEAAIATPKKVTVRRVSDKDAARQLAWQMGELSFQGETLAEAVAEFNRYNRIKIEVGDPSIAALQVGGMFRALDVDSFVAALGRSFGITATTAADGTVMLAGGSTTPRE